MVPRVALLLIILLATPSHASDYAPIGKALSIAQVPGKPIYYSIGNTGVPNQANEGNTSNGGFVVTDDGVVVYDALGTPSLGWALLQQIRKVTDKPVRYVVVSHYHADHIYGLQAFKDHTGAVVVAQERAAEYRENDETADERADARLRQRQGALFPWVDERTRIVPPDITFAERATLTLGGKRLVLLYAGPAHSASDMMMMIEPDGVLFAGDIVQNGRIPHMNSDDVDTGRWLSALKQVEELKPGFIIPGHGEPSSEAAKAIAFTAGYIADVRRVMQAAVDTWTDFDAAYRAADWSAYDKLPAFAANNRGNAYRVFLELEGANFGDGKKAEP
ncbi:MBL fold metallo-hydrolase [Methylobacterium sp. C25]|uniref:MBL fold metallo-hydrolase n=1 Tax=Methylobacterium sp. C25 TaxID=2721622 RepID=UPI001F19CDE7|nr:MBL fold metallo-hydrolase [Methylobacterium sp. C25]MCE4226489.1 MBL fold metallo-hydrolase [Methylobacterium sp. C25]